MTTTYVQRVRLANPDADIDDRLRHTKHGNWGSDRYGGYHDDRDCCMNGRHLLSDCGVNHRFLGGPCPVVRMWCPERGAEIQVEVAS